MNWEDRPGGVFTFDGALVTKGRASFKAYGGRDQTGVLNGTHLHEVKLRQLANVRGMQPELKVSGQVSILTRVIDPRTPTLTHFEPTNMRIDFTLPIQKRGSLTFGAEAGPWIEGAGNEFKITAGARATIRLRLL